MIDLDSEIWSQLRHAYGDADDVPDMLRRLEHEDPSALDELFGSICHQGSVYTASFAAVPHIVRTARGISSHELRAQMLVLVGSIHASSDSRGTGDVPAEIKSAYELALPEALELTVATLREPMDSETAIYLLEGAAALKGHVELGRFLHGFAGEEFTCDCPNCTKELYVWPDEDVLTVAAEDPVFAPSTARKTVEAGPIAGSAYEAVFPWLADLASAPPLENVRRLLPHLFGTATCPACESSFSLVDRLGQIYSQRRDRTGE